jgi:hypothetical protein
MTRYWLAGAAALALMTGAVFAQGMSSDTKTSTTTTSSSTAPAAGSYSSTQTQRSIDSNGDATDKSQTYQSGASGSNASSSSRTTSPDGTQQNTYHEERSSSPSGGSTITKKSSTTIDRWAVPGNAARVFPRGIPGMGWVIRPVARCGGFSRKTLNEGGFHDWHEIRPEGPDRRRIHWLHGFIGGLRQLGHADENHDDRADDDHQQAGNASNILDNDDHDATEPALRGCRPQHSSLCWAKVGIPRPFSAGAWTVRLSRGDAGAIMRTIESAHTQTRYSAVSMRLAAYLDEQSVAMHIVTDTGQTVTVVCPKDSIFAIQRHIEQIGRQCPEIATWRRPDSVRTRLGSRRTGDTR